MQTRSGYASVNQDINNQNPQGQVTTANPLNKYVCPDMTESATSTVQQVCDMAFFKRGNRWVDSRLVAEKPDARPARVIAFGSESSASWPRGWPAKVGRGASRSAATS